MTQTITRADYFQQGFTSTLSSGCDRYMPRRTEKNGCDWHILLNMSSNASSVHKTQEHLCTGVKFCCRWCRWKEVFESQFITSCEYIIQHLVIFTFRSQQETCETERKCVTHKQKVLETWIRRNKKRLGNNDADGLSRNFHFQTGFSLSSFRVQAFQHLGSFLMWFICMFIRRVLSDDFTLWLIATCLLANCYIHHVLFILSINTYFIQKASFLWILFLLFIW